MITMAETYQNIADENLEELRDDIPQGEIELKTVEVQTR
jgi:hypothetical protein